jgi:KipI family sensor histidine kinase inhibitor
VGVPEAEPEVRWVSDRCLRVGFGPDRGAETLSALEALLEALRAAPPPALEDLTPAYASVLLTFDLARLDADAAERAVRLASSAPRGTRAAEGSSRVVEVPTCYVGACAPDLAEVARLVSLPPDEVVRRHAGASYRVRFLGFAPGFPYLAGLPRELDVPRLPSPRARVPAGSVAVAGRQAGIYPEATPGGWRLLGRTPLVVFDASRGAGDGGPAWFRLGDEVRFVPRACAEHRDAVERAS